MTKFSYAEDFNEAVRVGAISDTNGEFMHCNVTVGDSDFSFLDFEKVFGANFSTKQDAVNAVALIQQTLELVDKNLSMGLNLADVRDECIASINHATSGNLITKRKATRAVRDICDYYISNGE